MPETAIGRGGKRRILAQLDRVDALQQIEALLEREGRVDLIGEVRSIAASIEAAETHRKTITEVTRALLESEKTYRLVFAHEMDPMALFETSTGRLLEVNDAWLQLYGYTREEALELTAEMVTAEPEASASTLAKLPPGATARINLRWHRAKHGTVFPVEVTTGKLMLEGREVAYAVMRDITQRQRAEVQLARSEASFRALIESMPDGVIVHRLGVIVYMSPSARQMLGYELEEDLSGMMALDIVHPADRPMVLERAIDVLTRGGPAPAVEERLLRGDLGPRHGVRR